MNIISDALEPPPSSLKYLPQLDSVRALAVLLVLWHHWYQPRHAPGPVGVWIFFVLSGFLITRILLKARRDTFAENQRAMGTFYIRRFLRIFPLYYFVLFIAAFTSAAFRADWLWYVSYLQNFQMIMAGKEDYIFGQHLWSLAVEEQFYIVWPMLMLFAPRKLLLPIICASIVFAVVIRAYLGQIGWHQFEVYIFTPSNLDTLGLGALLAYVVTYMPSHVVRLRWIALVTGIITFGIALVLKFVGGASNVLPLPMGLLTLWMVSLAADGIPGALGRIISWAPIIYIGRISYGIYVYHYFVPIVFRSMFERMGLKEGDTLFFIICFVMTMIVASLSWFLMEKPINDLKDRFAASDRPANASLKRANAE